MAIPAAFLAAARFGMGAAPGEADRIGADPRGWLAAQLVPQPGPPAPGTTADLFAQFRAVRAARQAAKRDEALPAPVVVPAMATPLRDIYVGEVAARTRFAASTPAPFHERLVQFWSNHFTVSIQRPEILAIAGAFEREAIRPHVTGRFRDLLQAAATHPAMLLYLDNAQSIGPDSIAGRRRDKGINENFARELLELHTLGVGGGYTQADVTAVAQVLTGWTLERGPDGPHGRFMFEPRFHQPGDKTLLGVTIREGGISEGLVLFDLLTRHPATARFVATKLVRHFVADDPPQPAVEAVAATFQASGGDLAATMRTLIARPEAWAHPLAKVRSPNDLVTATLRALGNPAAVDDKQILHSLTLLGQPPFAAPSPAGWPDRAESWLGPEALMHRLEWARLVGQKLGGQKLGGQGPGARAIALAEASIGPAMSLVTRATIASAPDPREGAMLWLASAEFERR